MNIQYIEEAGSMECCLIVTDPNDPNRRQELRMPKFIADLILPKIQNGTLDATKLWNRQLNISKLLP